MGIVVWIGIGVWIEAEIEIEVEFVGSLVVEEEPTAKAYAKIGMQLAPSLEFLFFFANFRIDVVSQLKD